MQITVEKVAMIREDFNPKNIKLNLNIDWSIEYNHIDQQNMRFNLILKASPNFNFKVEGMMNFECFEKFTQTECSQIIFNHACDMFMNMISLTRQSTYELFNEDSTVKANTI